MGCRVNAHQATHIVLFKLLLGSASWLCQTVKGALIDREDVVVGVGFRAQEIVEFVSACVDAQCPKWDDDVTCLGLLCLLLVFRCRGVGTVALFS